MKRKYLLNLQPIPPTSEDTGLTVKVDENLIIIWRWKKGKVNGLYTIDVESGEHELYNGETNSWHKSRLATLLGHELYGNCYLVSYTKIFFDGEVKEACELAAKHTAYRYHTNQLDQLIREIEDRYSVDTRERRENNRLAKIDRLMSSVPDIPKDFEDWILRISGNDRYYALADAKSGQMHCSCCGGIYEGAKKTAQKDRCIHCGAEMIVDRRRKNGIERDVHVALLQNINGKIAVARHFDISIFHGKKRTVSLSESERLIIYRDDPKYYYDVYYAQNPRGCRTRDFDNKRNPYNRQIFNGYLYPLGIKEALKGTCYEAGIPALSAMAADGAKLNYGKMMSGIIDKRIAGIAEYLQKGRFGKLLKELEEENSYFSTRNRSELAGLNLNETDPEKIFGMKKQCINRLRDKDGGEQTLRWLRWSEQNNKKLSDETLTWLNKSNVSVDESIFLVMSPKQVMNYVTRQQSESYSGRTVKGVLEQWSDYIRMCEKLGKDTTDEMVYRPRELKRRHEECVEEIRQQQAVIDMKNNKKASEERAAKLRADYPLAEAILAEIKPKYEYESEQYKIIVPNNLVEITLEGHALHHCVASSDRYFERIERQETYICFLRHTEKPDIPFYTIEIEPGGTIRQHRSYYDEEPGIDEIRGFLREWQQVVRKRLKEEDWKLAKESKKLREANIKELKEKNNTRVLLGLMEDFMEAV